MGGISYALGSVLTGAAEGLHDQAVQDDADARQQALQEATTAREMALERLRAANADQQDANHQARQFAYGAQENVQKQNFEQSNIRLTKSLDLSNDKALEAVKQQYHLTDIQAQSMADLQKELRLAGQTVDHWAVTTDGRMVAFNKQGKVMSASSNPGSFVPTGESVSDSDGLGGGGTIAGEAANRGGGIGGASPKKPAPAAATKPVGQGSSKLADALAQAGNVYAAASQNPQAYRDRYPGMFDQNGNLLPREQVIAKIQQTYGGQ